MNTRTERMNNKVYCAYCGKKLRDYNFGIFPESPLTCNCEKAKRELELYDELKGLYNTPLAESLIDMKVKEYRDKLLGIQAPCSVTTILDADDSCLISSKVCIDDDTYTSGGVYLE